MAKEIDSKYEQWQDETLKPVIGKYPERKPEFENHLRH